VVQKFESVIFKGEQNVNPKDKLICFNNRVSEIEDFGVSTVYFCSQLELMLCLLSGSSNAGKREKHPVVVFSPRGCLPSGPIQARRKAE
jgi:hypothetical protein